jgi:hypothetical protein
MATENLTFSCASVHVEPISSRVINVEVGEADIDEILDDMNVEILAEYVVRKFEPEDIFSETQLEKWAEANGYVKSTDNG